MHMHSKWNCVMVVLSNVFLHLCQISKAIFTPVLELHTKDISIHHTQHIEAETKWSPFSKGHFQMHFLYKIY